MALPSLATTKTYQLVTDKTDILNPDNKFVLISSKIIDKGVSAATNDTKGTAKTVLSNVSSIPETIELDVESLGLALISVKANGDYNVLYENTGEKYWGIPNSNGLNTASSLTTNDGYKETITLNSDNTVTVGSVAAQDNRALYFNNTFFRSYKPNTSYSLPYFYKEVVLQKAVDDVNIAYSINETEATVTLSCATEGATIYYGYAEDKLNKVYSAPFRVTDNIKIFAQAVLGEEKSNITECYIDLPYTSFKKVLDNSEPTDNIVIVGDFEVIYQNKDKNRLILTDGTSNLLIYKQNSGYSIDYPVGTKISKIEGLRATYYSCFRLIDAELTEGGEGASYTPIELTSFEGLSYDDSLFDEVVIKGCNISGKDLGSPVIELDGETVALYDVFGIGYENISGCDITGFVWRYKDVLEIVPISIEGGEVTGTVETPVITPNKRELDLDEEVTIKCTTEGAVIYYTLDGTEPTQESEKYTAPIPFKESCTIKARAFYEGEDKTMFPSAIASRDYHVIDPTCNIISEGNHDVDEKNTLNSYKKHACIVDGVEYHMNAAHLGEGGNGNDGSASSIMMNYSTTKDKERFCYLIQVSENVGYVLDKIELAYNYNEKVNTVFAVRGANTPFDDSAESRVDYEKAIKGHGDLIGSISKDSQSIAFEKDYKYFALYPTSTGAVYLDNITIRYREPAPLTTPALTGLEDLEEGNVVYNDEEGIYEVAISEPIEIDFDFDVNWNPDVKLKYVITPLNGGISPLAMGDDDFGMSQTQLQEFDGNSIEISASCALQYWVMNIKTEETSEPLNYKFVLLAQLDVPEMTGLDEATVEGDAVNGYVVMSNKALNVGFMLNEDNPNIMVSYTLTTNPDEYNKAFDREDLIPYDGDEDITISESCLMNVVAVDYFTMQMSEPVRYEFIVTPPVAPELPEFEVVGGKMDGNFINSEGVVTIKFKPVDGIHVYYKTTLKNEPAKARDCAHPDGHADFTKHDGVEEIELNATHDTFSVFACNPETDQHSDVVTYKVGVATGVNEIEAADAADTLYFDLNGFRVVNPEKGTYIRITKGKAEKVVK